MRCRRFTLSPLIPRAADPVDLPGILRQRAPGGKPPVLLPT
jgi:hypothetical protein